MTRNITVLILIIAAIFLVVYYYKASSIKLSSAGVALTVNSKDVLHESNSIQTTPITFSNVNIMQSKLSDGTYYEVATCEPLYEFNQNSSDLIKTLFEADKVETLFSIKGVSAMRIILKNSQVINLFLDDNDMKELKLFYGVPYEKFSKSVALLQGEKFKEFQIGGMFELPVAMTKWNSIHNDFDGIITSIDY